MGLSIRNLRRKVIEVKPNAKQRGELEMHQYECLFLNANNSATQCKGMLLLNETESFHQQFVGMRSVIHTGVSLPCPINGSYSLSILPWSHFSVTFGPEILNLKIIKPICPLRQMETLVQKNQLRKGKMKKIPTAVLTLSLFILGIVGCGDPKKLNEHNVTKAINIALAKQPGCIIVQFNEPDGYRADQHGAFSNQGTVDGMDALVASGLLQSTSVTREIKDWSGAKQVEFKHYSLTSAGEKARSKTPPVNFMTGVANTKDPYFCYATAQVNKVVKWTEPNLGPVIVDYTQKYKDVPAWAKNPDVQKAFGGQNGGNSDFAIMTGLKPSDVTHQAALELTNLGWESKGFL